MSPSSNNKKIPPFDDCERPACSDMQSMLNQTQQQMNMNSTKKSTASSSPSSSSSSACPVNSSALGRASWTLLHSMAAWYPDQPSIEDQRSMTDFFTTLSKFYPCTYCAQDFQEQIQARPIQVKSRTDLCIWLCEQHNTVNEKLGKDPFPCTIQQLDQRWRKSDNPKCKDSSLH